MGRRGLSCEAFLWLENEDDGKKYLCRGEICSNPEVLPQTGKHYWDYNIYDWFEHLGFHYSKNGDPAREDFPIKLAGYFNRLKEIIEVLECRGCSSLMVPNLEYARNIEYARYSPEQKAFVKERLTAAYRVTVFHCVSPNCPENGKDYYINHCLGFGCYTIIDSRDLRQRCRNKRYICRNCGSCCKSCAEENPVGFCPECGSALILFEKNGKRFVYCGNRQCGFKISENNLTKKFHSQKFPVRKV